VRKLLVKNALLRPSASQALCHPFLALWSEELDDLYEDLVVSTWVTMEKPDDLVLVKIAADTETQRENVSDEDDENGDDASQTALLEIDGNASEKRERKRQKVDGKENDSQISEEEVQQRKRRKLED
jgi:hypothetical protein